MNSTTTAASPEALTFPVPDMDKLLEFAGKMVVELGAAASGALVVLGDRLGLYRGLVATGPCTPEELAAATGTDARYVREWLSNQAASGYVDYLEDDGLFHLNPEQAAVFADPESPVHMTGGFASAMSLYFDVDRIEAAYRSGEGVSWGDHHDCMAGSVAKFFRPSYHNHMVQSWIPSLTGAEAKLRAGARVADIGCGHGHSTMMLAAAYPESRFVGFDPHVPSVEEANRMAAAQGLTNVEFEVGTAKQLPLEDWDLVTVCDALHDMGDPVGAAARVRQALAPDGSFMIVEPMAGDALEENLNPVGRAYYAFSSMICTPCSRSQEVGLALGAQAGQVALTAVLTEAGFGAVRRASETPFNQVLEARA